MCTNDTNADLFAFEFNLKILGRFLGDSTSKIELVDLGILIPEGRLVLHQELLVARAGRNGGVPR